MPDAGVIGLGGDPPEPEVLARAVGGTATCKRCDIGNPWAGREPCAGCPDPDGYAKARSEMFAAPAPRADHEPSSASAAPLKGQCACGCGWNSCAKPCTRPPYHWRGSGGGGPTFPCYCADHAPAPSVPLPSGEGSRAGVTSSHWVEPNPALPKRDLSAVRPTPALPTEPVGMKCSVLGLSCVRGGDECAKAGHCIESTVDDTGDTGTSVAPAVGDVWAWTGGEGDGSEWKLTVRGGSAWASVEVAPGTRTLAWRDEEFTDGTLRFVRAGDAGTKGAK